MTELEEAQQQINRIVDFWRASKGLTGAQLTRMLVIFAHIDVLQRHQNVEQLKYVELINKCVADGEPVNSAERKADQYFSLANSLRRRIRTATKCGEAIRSQLSYIKTELNTLGDNT
jgi:hypothetical protein